MSPLKSAYKVLRSMIMTLIVLLVMIYLGLYVVLSVPSVQKSVKEKACRELSSLMGGDLTIGTLTVRPFSEVLLSDVALASPEGERCARIGKVAAGIDLWSLFFDRRIVLNYAEIIGLDARLVQKVEGGPLNIQFLIDAFSPKDRTRPSAEFDLKIRNVVVRDSRALFSRPWMNGSADDVRGLADIEVSRLRMDLSVPVLRNDLFRFDVRKIQFLLSSGLDVRNLSARVSFVKDVFGAPGRLAVSDLSIALPNTSLVIGDLDLKLDSIRNFDAVVRGRLTPSDFSAFLPALESFSSPWGVNVDASLRGEALDVSEFRFEEAETGSLVTFVGSVRDFSGIDSLEVNVDSFKADLSARLISGVMPLVAGLGEKGRGILVSLGRSTLELDKCRLSGGDAEATGRIQTECGAIGFKGVGYDVWSRKPRVKLTADVEDVEVGRLLSTDRIGKVTMSLDADVIGIDRNVEGSVRLRSGECFVLGMLAEVEAELNKKANDLDVKLRASSRQSELSLSGFARLAGSDSRIMADLGFAGFNLGAFGLKGKSAQCDVSARLSVDTKGDNADNLTGLIAATDISVSRHDGNRLFLPGLRIAVDTLSVADLDDRQVLMRDVRIDSDWLDARMSGCILPGTLGAEMKSMLESVFPTLFPRSPHRLLSDTAENDFSFEVNVKGVSDPYVFFNIPVRPLTDIPFKGSVDASEGKASLSFATPHLLQGKNKIIRDIGLKLDLDSFLGMAKVSAGLVFPAKKGDAELVADIYAVHDKVNVNIGINPTLESTVKGSVGLSAAFSRLPDPFNPAGTLAVSVDLLPSSVAINDMAWSIADGTLDYCGKRISVSNFLISHDDQFVRVSGSASESPDDVVKVDLNDIDLEYIFNILNINYVSFGGMATGEVVGSRLLTKAPEARTEFLRVKGLSYNGAVLGDGDLASEYDSGMRKVGIYGVIRDPLTRQRRVSVDGGIWVTRDSLSFSIDADKVNVEVMKPFVSAFCSDLYGAASGKCKLFGTFSDIDLIGALRADTLSMKLDFTNTWYHAGGDSVFLDRGVIDIPPLTLYDDEGHTAEFSGSLSHRYFHDPVFGFRLRDARSLLCYNTNERINPLWYGTIYGSGHAQINGHPGLIEIDMNMTTEEGSKFYYVISDAEDVAQYSFLSFTDRRKESMKAVEVDSVPDYLKRFHRQTQEMEAESSNVVLSLKGTVTNDALVTLVMDPRAGDNITARGQGALQMDYNLASNDLRMIGTYVLDEGNYNFTLQDIIIKNFSIRKGSLIKFDGDPMKAVLDIAATYRVNTNLTDLDKSFSTDKELNRTNVPVDAVLLVDGPMTNPDITFDIELPSLTSDVERKVKSIVSTNDMMNRQIIYLLALNRFYTPEYTGGQSNGSEWSSMASSTISSQLSNILSQMTDKLDVSPSFRSEKGDFSDMEFDLALSSRLLNNRLLINGNFGYRDRTTSNTQFVGDFDIEYLLSKNGNLRLKAYNHFNDQNYYLRSALTTQGVGVVFRRDFDRMFGRKKRNGESKDEDTLESDTLTCISGEKEREISSDSIRER